MKNKDLLKQENMKLMQRLSEALKEDNEEAMAEAFSQFASGVQDRIMEEYGDLQQNRDSAILAARGVRQLTSNRRYERKPSVTGKYRLYQLPGCYQDDCQCR